MIATAILWIRSNRLLASVAGLAALMVAAGLAWVIAVHLGERREAKRQDAARAAAIASALTRDSAAKEAAAARRRVDDAAVAAQSKELHDALQSLPDSVPDRRRLALACARLQVQDGSVPAVCM